MSLSCQPTKSEIVQGSISQMMVVSPSVARFSYCLLCDKLISAYRQSAPARSMFLEAALPHAAPAQEQAEELSVRSLTRRSCRNRSSNTSVQYGRICPLLRPTCPVRPVSAVAKSSRLLPSPPGPGPGADLGLSLRHSMIFRLIPPFIFASSVKYRYWILE